MYIRVPEAVDVTHMHALPHLSSPTAAEENVSSSLSLSQFKDLHLSSSPPGGALQLNQTQAEPGNVGN